MTKNTRDNYADPADSDHQIISPTWSNDGQCQSYPFCCPIEAALLRMSSHSYSLGEEIIGKVAFMGHHCWISSSVLGSTFVYNKYHQDWQFQFAAGTKTVLLVPVIPYGVLHLGSLYMREDHALRLDESAVPDPPSGQEFSSTSIKQGFMTSKMAVSLPKGINKSVTEECRGHTIHDVHRKKSVDVKHESEKNEVHRPRPRDRQLLQDGMKELRELIPNASKCSIDALLERTITQMLFLQSVSEKAEKVEKKTRNNKLNDEAKKQQQDKCPLRVQELEQPDHLLIEMLCKEYGVFFETAHLFKGLEVSILKGELENRSGELWVRFVIQASKCSNKMQILCPLMYLSQRR